MQAIITRVLPITNTKPTRIKASCARGSIILSSDNLRENAHRAAVQVLIGKFAKEDSAKYGTPIAGNPWLKPFVTGQLPSGDFCHVFLS